MDCEKFDSHVIDALYDELDEVTTAAMKRHADTCARCAGVLSGLRATREVGVLPIEEPSDDLEDRILAAAAAAQQKAPWHRKVVRAIAWAGSHAMRPQLAMAALLVLMLGSSLLLLRAKPGTVGVAPVRVTERGVPEPERAEAQSLASAPPPAAAAATAAPTALAALDEDRGGEGAKKGGAKEADGPAAEAKAKDGKDSKEAAALLADARETKARSGCEPAVMKYDEVGVRFRGTAAAATAMWEAAECYKSMGNGSRARELYTALAEVDGYQDKAKLEIAASHAQSLGNMIQLAGWGHTAAGGAARAAAPAKAAARPAEAAAPAPAAPPNATPGPGAPPPAGKPAAPAPMRDSAF